MNLKTSFVKAPNPLKIFIIVILVFVVGYVVTFFKGESKSQLEQSIESQLKTIETNHHTLAFNDLVNKLVLEAPFDLSKLSPDDQNLAFLHIFIDYYTVLKPLLASYQEIYHPIQASVFMFGMEYRGIGNFVKTNFPNLTRLKYRKLSDFIANSQYKDESARIDAHTFITACHKFNNFNFSVPTLSNQEINATTQASSHQVDAVHPFTLSQLTIPNTTANHQYINSVLSLKTNLANLCQELEQFQVKQQ